jgi:hypothetical protein
MSDGPRVLLTFERRGIIVAKQFGYVDGGIRGVVAVCDDGSSRLFAVKSDPTNAEFYKIKIVANASQDDQRKAVEDATRWSEDEFPWVETDSKGDVIEGTDTLGRMNAWLNAETKLENLEYWGLELAGQYAPGFAIRKALSSDEQSTLGLREVDLGGPISSVPCIFTTASIDELNKILAAKKLPFVFIDDEGPEDWH